MAFIDRGRRRVLAAGLALAAVPYLPARAQDVPTGGMFSLFVPTPDTTVRRMLEIADVKAGDHVVDLGSGDGRIVITAAAKYGARGLGVDIDAELVERSRVAAREAGVADRAQFDVGDVLQADLRGATIVTMYLFPELISLLQPKLLRELKPGTRIVIHDFAFATWTPDHTESFHAPEKYFGSGGDSRVSLWIVPATAGGRWRLSLDGQPAPLDVQIRQTFQLLDVAPVLAGKGKPVFAGGRVRGQAVTFTLDLTADGATRRHVFDGVIEGEAMRGTVRAGGGAPTPWTARRAG
jgi:hypothetical protein